MKIESSLIRRVEDKLIETYSLAEKQFARTFVLPDLSFDLGGFRTAGRANLGDNKISINPKFLIEFPEIVIGNTVGHEVAHLITDTIYSSAKQHHGPEWKLVAVKLNVKPIRCHSMILEERIKKSFEYKCPQCSKLFYLSPTKHKRTVTGQSHYLCTDCRCRIVRNII